MPDVERDTTTAWTPGPWRVGDLLHVPGLSGTVIESCSSTWEGSPTFVAVSGDIDTINVTGIGDPDANHALIALAPEMAEAILQLADPQEHVIEDHIVHIAAPDAVLELADKLRAIGGADV